MLKQAFHGKPETGPSLRQHTVLTPHQFSHFYSTEVNGELVLFDTGPSTPGAFTYLKEQIDLKRLKYLFITHSHSDHFGLVPAIAKASDTEIYLSRSDVIKLSRREERLFHFEKLLVECGIDREMICRLVDRCRKEIWPLVDTKRFGIVEESDVSGQLGIRWLSFPGHSQSDMVYLYCDYAISGDILLHNIFQVPFLDVDAENFSKRFSHYRAYCTSLPGLMQLTDYKIRPGHNWGVPSLVETIVLYVSKLLQRAARVKALDGVETVQEVISQLFGPLSVEPMYIYAKVSEILFMRDFLAEPHKLKSSLEQIGLFDQVRTLYTAVAD